MTTRERAARELGQLLATDAVGTLLDQVADDAVRADLRRALARLRGVAEDERAAAALVPGAAPAVPR